MAPEVLNKSKYTEKADVFSFGVLLTELFTGRVPYGDDAIHALHLAQQIVGGLRPSVAGLSSELVHIVEDCWLQDAKMRPNMSEITVRLRRLRSQQGAHDDVQSDAIADDDEVAGTEECLDAGGPDSMLLDVPEQELTSFGGQAQGNT